MYYLFFLLYLTSLSYILFKKRTVDMFTILFGGLFYYSIPLLIGKITLIGVVINQEISNQVYMVYSFVFIVSLGFMFKNDRKLLRPVTSNPRNILDSFTSNRISFLTFVVLLIFLLGVFKIGISNYLVATKSNNEESIMFIQISVMLSVIMLPISLYYRKKTSFFIYFLIIFSFFLYGARSYLVISLISSIFIMFNFKKSKLIKQLPLFVLGFIFAFVMAIYKYVYKIIYQVSFSELSLYIKDLEYNLIFSQLLADPMAVIYNLNYTIINDINLPISFLFHRILSVFPGGGSFFSSLTKNSYPRYSYILNELEYTTVHWGLASSVYAELLAISGVVGFVLVYISINKLVIKFNKNIILKGLNFYNLLFISSFTYFLFYSHRLDITFILGMFKYSVLIWVIFKYIFISNRL